MTGRPAERGIGGAEPDGRASGGRASGGRASGGRASGGRVLLRAGEAEVDVSPIDGGRVAALRVDGLGVLKPDGWGEIAWGCYPMVPWAGRLGEGGVVWRGRRVEVARTMPPHAIHGTALRKPWRVTSVARTGAAAVLEVDLAPEWPLGGWAIHRVELLDGELRCTLEVHAGAEAMPAIVGWHPWFPRRLGRGGTTAAVGGELELEFRPAAMLVRGADGLPSGEVAAPAPPGPWDDAFTGVVAPPVVRWPGALEVTLHADAPVWVAYTEQPDAIAVEPQTGPPNGLNSGELAVVEPGRPLVATMSLRWRSLSR